MKRNKEGSYVLKKGPLGRPRRRSMVSYIKGGNLQERDLWGGLGVETWSPYDREWGVEKAPQ